ncbi:hypothetical protein evm_005134, partial [Chilo suppressalis]
MADRTCMVLNSEELSAILNNSEYEDDSDSQEPDYREPELSSSSSDSEEDNHSINTSDRGRQRTRGGYRTRIRTRGGFVRRMGRPRTRGSAGERRSLRPHSSWSKIPFNKPEPVLLEPSYLPTYIGSDNIYEYFQEYIDDDILELIVQKSNQSAVERTGRSLGLTKEECEFFIGISMIMSCVNYPHIRMYWNERWALPLITEAMTRDRFFLLRNSLKLVYDNDIATEMRAIDKLWKVRPLLDKIIKGCRKQKRSLKISIDEMIIPFTGACHIKQYCPGKPNPTGTKVFVLANPNGLVCDLLVYQGKNTMTENIHSLGEGVVLKLTETLTPGHVIFFDRYFTTFKLAETLNSMGFKCAGTIMRNRIPAYIKEMLETDRTLSRKGRGSYDVLVGPDSILALTKWYDNKPVTFLSTIYAADNPDYCRRYDRSIRQYIQVPRPEVVKEYNSNMGGVDLTDRLLAVCPSRGRTKKWTVRFIAHCFDLAIVNAWIKYKEEKKEERINLHKIMQLREFKRVLGEKLIEKNLYKENTIPDSALDQPVSSHDELTCRRRGRPSLKALPSEAKRHHGAYHLPEHCADHRAAAVLLRLGDSAYSKSNVTVSQCSDGISPRSLGEASRGDETGMGGRTWRPGERGTRPPEHVSGCTVPAGADEHRATSIGAVRPRLPNGPSASTEQAGGLLPHSLSLQRSLRAQLCEGPATQRSLQVY